jgi:hypothetical protein
MTCRPWVLTITLYYRKQQLGLSNQIHHSHASLLDQIHQLERRLLNAIEGRHSSLTTDLSSLDQVRGRIGSNSSDSAMMPWQTHEQLVRRFEDNLQCHQSYRNIECILQNVPLKDWAGAAAWWIENGPSRTEEAARPELYLNLLKAAWLLNKAKETPAFGDLGDESIWIQYMGALSDKVAEITSDLTSGIGGDSALPSVDTLLHLPLDCFRIWAEPLAVSSSYNQGPREEKLLELHALSLLPYWWVLN